MPYQDSNPGSQYQTPVDNTSPQRGDRQALKPVCSHKEGKKYFPPPNNPSYPVPGTPPTREPIHSECTKRYEEKCEELDEANNEIQDLEEQLAEKCDELDACEKELEQAKKDVEFWKEQYRRCLKREKAAKANQRPGGGGGAGGAPGGGGLAQIPDGKFGEDFDLPHPGAEDFLRRANDIGNAQRLRIEEAQL